MKNSGISLRIWLIATALAVLTVSALLCGCTAKEAKEVSYTEVSYTEVSYGQVLQMFRNEEIISADIDRDDTLMFETDQGFFRHQLRDVYLFYEDLHEEIDRLIERGRLVPENFNFSNPSGNCR